MPTGLVTGLFAEQALIKKHSREWAEMPLIRSHGPGPAAAEKAAQELVHEGARGLVSFGFAGGIDEAVAPGTLMLPGIVREGRDSDHVCDQQWQQKLVASLGETLTVDTAVVAAVDAIAATADDKLQLRYRTDAAAVDMESGAVAKVAARSGIPFVVIRSVLDPALQSLPILAIEATGPEGRLRPWRIVWSLLRHPGQLGELRRLNKNLSAAAKTLARVCKLVGPGFGLD